METHIRAPAVAGMFYPGNNAELRSTLSSLLNTSPDAPHQQPKGLLVPHAGYVYSGSTAAAAYARLQAWQQGIRRVVLLGPCHRVAVRGIALASVAAFATPLGSIRLDPTAAASLADLPYVSINDAAHAAEHSLEVQLPFLQTVLKDFTLVPLVVGDASPDQVAAVLDRLWGGAETLIVISSDLSHYLPYSIAQQIDQHTCNAILANDGQLVPEQACGAFPLNGFLLAAKRHGLQPELIAQCNSGDTAGDRARVVGYAAFAFAPEEHDHA